jgi:transcriptional adapter 2-alpha
MTDNLLNKKRQRASSKGRDTESTKRQKLDTFENANKQMFNVDVNSKILCAICNTEISKLVKVVCIDCPDTVHCLECLLTHKVLQDHSDHEYSIVNCLDFPIFTSEWNANEELLLLTGIYQR